jgi:hypothetical protein
VSYNIKTLTRCLDELEKTSLNLEENYQQKIEARNKAMVLKTMAEKEMYNLQLSHKRFYA